MAVDGNLKTRFEASALPLMRRVYAAALYLTENRADAEDLLQETYLRAYRFFDRFVAGTNLRAWLLTILRNVLRKFQQEHFLFLIDGDRVQFSDTAMYVNAGSIRYTLTRGTQA